MLSLYCHCVCSSLTCVWLFETPWTVARQAPLSMGFSRQGYWSGLQFPSPGDFPVPGIEPRSPDCSPSEPPGLCLPAWNSSMFVRTDTPLSTTLLKYSVHPTCLYHWTFFTYGRVTCGLLELSLGCDDQVNPQSKCGVRGRGKKKHWYHGMEVKFLPGWGRSPGEGNGNSLQYSCLENPTDRGAWQTTVHGITIIMHRLLVAHYLWPMGHANRQS